MNQACLLLIVPVSMLRSTNVILSPGPQADIDRLPGSTEALFAVSSACYCNHASVDGTTRGTNRLVDKTPLQNDR